ncbi:MAG: AAA family ATPase [Victivallales bacterium]|nr:AAA family ATPase [Victivallales bacterium]
MKIQTLHLKNFRCFDDFTIEFNAGDSEHGGLTVLVAKNGEGKTAILDAVNISLGIFFRKMPNSKGNVFLKRDLRYIDDLNAMHKKGYTSLETIFLDTASLLDDKTSLIVRRESFFDKSKKLTTTLKDGKDLENFAQFCLSLRFENHTTLPLFAYYGDSRLWFDKEKVKDAFEKQTQDRALGYAGANSSGGGFRQFFEWFVDLYRSWYDQQRKKEKNLPSFNKEAFEKYEMFNQMISNALADALEMTGWYLLDCDFSEKVIWVTNSQTKEKADILSLSAGNRIVLGVVGDIIHRCCVLNPHLGLDVLKKASGIVMIDEIELHLHPSWQQRILPVLQRIFPRIQFIVTTHSPQVVSSVPRECVRIIDNGEVEHLSSQTEGVESQNILAEIFGTDPAPQDDEFVKMLNEYARMEAYDEADTPKGKQLYEKLAAHYGADYPPLMRIEIHRKFKSSKH